MKDCHIHFMPQIGPADPQEVFLKKADQAGITGGTIISLPPKSFRDDPERSQHWRDRLDWILEYTEKTPGFHPFFWIDPTEKDAFEQISTAAEKGVWGFKCICNHFFPKECLKEFSAISETNLPVHFHTGILFDHYASSEFVRPIAYECLLEVPGIRFALAHVGNPWVDEYILLYAKFQAAMLHSMGKRNLRMFIDLTPGVTRLRRESMFQMLFLSCYANPCNDILWGSDNRINNYAALKTQNYLALDKTLISGIRQQTLADPEHYPQLPDDIWEKITDTNFNGFYGK